MNRTPAGCGPALRIALRLALMLALLCLLGTALACAPKKPVEPVGPDVASTPEVAAPPAFISSGDEVEVKFPYAENLNTIQRVDPQGDLDMPLVGRVKAAGETPETLAAHLKQAYTEQLRHPEVVVLVKEFYVRRVYVGGAVVKPGFIQMPGRLSALEAIMEAGGFDLSKADLAKVVVLREKGGKRVSTVLDYSKLLEGQDVQSFELEPRDIVHVPKKSGML